MKVVHNCSKISSPCDMFQFDNRDVRYDLERAFKLRKLHMLSLRIKVLY